MTQPPAGAHQDRDEARALSPERVRRVACCWVAVAAAAYVLDLLRQTGTGWTNGAGRPLGDDFLNYWSAANLAWHGKAAAIYDWFAFHRFEQDVVGAPIDFYHYSYPPVLLLLTAPLAALPYAPGLALWLLAGWSSFYYALRTAWAAPNALLLALATPAVFVNAVAGQNGTWTAALLGGGLSLLDRRPLTAGIMLGCLCYKPQLALLVPVALIAGRRWPTFAAAATTSAVLVLASVVLFGTESWQHYFDNVALLRRTILEDGTGVWHRMLSVFVFARRVGAGVSTAYAVQTLTGLIAASVVALAWRRDVDEGLRCALVVLGSCLATPYLQDYDLVVGAFVVAWVVRAPAKITAPTLGRNQQSGAANGPATDSVTFTGIRTAAPGPGTRLAGRKVSALIAGAGCVHLESPPARALLRIRRGLRSTTDAR